jgi:hypothetical protein
VEALRIKAINVRALLYDDKVFFAAPDEKSLQKMIDNLPHYFNRSNRKINLKKSKVIMFKIGAR